MNICISKHVTGTPDDIEINIDNSSCRNIPIIGSAGFEDLARVYSIILPSFPSEPYRKCYKAFSGDISIPWKMCMPTEVYERELSEYLRIVKTSLTDVDFSYYENVYTKTELLFDVLEPVKINCSTYEEHLEDETKQGISVLRTFKPNQGGYASRVEYSKSSTVTGRLKVTSGPNILHLNKDYRNILESKWKSDGSLVYLDYKSLEPRVLLVTNKLNSTSNVSYSGSLPRDIYQHIITELNLDGLVDREDIKTTIISLLYGASRDSVIHRLKNIVESPNDLIDLVIEYFGLEALKNKLAQEYESSERRFICNFYGRPIFCENTSPSTLLNYYIQSTAVDAALLGFQKIVDRLVSTNTLDVFSPRFILHDALILDVHNSVKHLVPKLCKLGETIPYLGEEKFFLEDNSFVV